MMLEGDVFFQTNNRTELLWNMRGANKWPAHSLSLSLFLSNKVKRFPIIVNERHT